MIDSSLAEPTMQSQTPSSTLNTQIEDPVVITMPQTSSSSLQHSFGTTAPLLPNTTVTTSLGHADITATIQTVTHPVSSSPPISFRELNFFRIALLIFRRVPIAVRTFFDSKHPPLDLISDLALNKPKLLAIKKERVISTQQWNILYPSSGYVTSRQFDVTTLILLLRYMTSVPAPVTGFDKLPSQSDNSVGADLARMKYYRNIVAHSKNAKLSEMEFNDYWADIENAIGRLGGNEQLLEARALKTLQFE
ncbi:E3 ubiquitin-protein ligase DZIP3-like [Saccostrea cucullata]|uniref:E3 ubiquitin-protein ligase DZIP3-like n=1 Tax=Saccostrea cuccullata TaxID=36930 RepID=UPI002ED4ACC9